MHILKWQMDFRLSLRETIENKTFHEVDCCPSSSEKESSECAPHCEAAEMVGFPLSLHRLDLQIDDLTIPETSPDGLHPKNWCEPVHLARFPQSDSEVRDAMQWWRRDPFEGTQLKTESMDCSTEVGLFPDIVVLHHTLVQNDVIHLTFRAAVHDAWTNSSASSGTPATQACSR